MLLIDERWPSTSADYDAATLLDPASCKEYGCKPWDF